MNYQAILFDMDGTVLDTLDDLKNAVNAALEAHGYPLLRREQLRRYLGNGSRRLIERALGDSADAQEIDAVLAWYKPYYDAHCHVHTRPYPGILSMLERLQNAGLRLAIVSNKPDSAVKELAAAFFPSLNGPALGEREAEGVRRKPAPDLIDAARESLHLPREVCLYVGDSEVDLLTAQNAGLDCVSVSWGFRSRDELLAAGAQRIVDTPEALAALIVDETAP